MAIGRYLAHRKTADGSYEDVYLKSESGLIYRPNGRTVEQDLAAYLPEYQNSDTVPESLSQGKLLTGLNKAWLNLNGIKELATKSDIPSIPSIPSVIDNLTSSLTTAALSANQGRILKGLIDTASSGSSSGSIECLVNNASLSVNGKNSSSRSVSVSDYKIIFVYCPEYTYDGSTSGNNWDSYGYISSDISGTFVYRALYDTTLITKSYTGTLPIIESPRAILIFNTNKATAIELSTCVSVNNHSYSAGM